MPERERLQSEQVGDGMVALCDGGPYNKEIYDCGITL